MKHIIPLLLSVFWLNACSNAVEGTNTPQNPITKADTTAPTWTALPDNSGLLRPSDDIVVIFNESMNTTSLSVTSDLSNESSPPAWSATSQQNDTLTISPNPRWTDGLRRAIRIDAADNAGNPSTPIILSYDVDSTPPRVTANPVYKISNTPLIITLTCDDGQGTGCDAIYYTINGTVPTTTNSLRYTGPVRIDRTTKFKYIAVDNAGVVSNYVSGWYTIDLVPPIGAVSPQPNTIIGSQQDIEVQFSESMDTNSLLLSGSLSAEVGVIEWTTVTAVNDHLILHPANGSNWNLGIDATLTITAQDLAGNILENDLGTTDVDLTYDIGTIHVSVDDINASNANPGTRTLPLTTIQSAIALASALPGPSQVLVAQGQYSASNLTFTGIVLAENVSLFGGFATDWSDRNPAAYGTTITAGDLTADPSFITIDPVSWAMSAGNGVSWRTIVDGFDIDGGIGINPVGPTAALYVEGGASPTIRSNVITGGDVKGRVYGVYLDSASPTLNSNTINGSVMAGATYLPSHAHGIYTTTNANPVIKKNTINGGIATSQATGIELNFASALVKNNDINGGDAAVTYGIISTNSTLDIYNNVISNLNALQDSYGMSIATGSTANIYNNIIDPGSLSANATGIFFQSDWSLVIKNNIITHGACVQEATINTNPLLVENNDLFNCQIDYYDADGGCTLDLDGDGAPTTCNVTEMNSLANIANNLTDDPQLQNPVNGDYRFTPNSPLSVIEGGVDLSVIFNGDKQENVRTAPWSIGAYEQDP